MKEDKMKAQKAETEQILDERDVVIDADEERVEDEAADNVADESFESGDNSSQVSCDADEWKDKYIRLGAEFDNYRKRTLREKMELISTGCEDVIKSLLNVMDDIDRAVAAVDGAKDIESVKQGVGLIHTKLMDTLKAKGVKEMEPIGQALDTDYYEAVAKIPVQGDQKGKIVEVVQKGYMLNDKVVRYAKVVVGE